MGIARKPASETEAWDMLNCAVDYIYGSAESANDKTVAVAGLFQGLTDRVINNIQNKAGGHDYVATNAEESDSMFFEETEPMATDPVASPAMKALFEYKKSTNTTPPQFPNQRPYKAHTPKHSLDGSLGPAPSTPTPVGHRGRQSGQGMMDRSKPSPSDMGSLMTDMLDIDTSAMSPGGKTPKSGSKRVRGSPSKSTPSKF